MNTIQLLNENGLDFLLDNNVDAKYIPHKDVYILNYQQIETNKKSIYRKHHPVVRECRNLIVRKLPNNKWIQISRSFERFFNYLEHKEETEIFNKAMESKEVVAYEKLDGSLIQLTYFDNTWHIFTRGSDADINPFRGMSLGLMKTPQDKSQDNPLNNQKDNPQDKSLNNQKDNPQDKSLNNQKDNPQDNPQNKSLNNQKDNPQDKPDTFGDHVRSFIKDFSKLNTDYIYIFELCTPLVHITHYDKEKLTLLTIIDRTSNQELPDEYQDQVSYENAWSQPEILYPTSIEEIYQHINKKPKDYEGYVLKYKSMRMKVKSQSYVTLHHIGSKINTKWDLLRVVVEGESDETSAVLKQYRDDLKSLDEILNTQYTLVENFWQTNQHLDRKEYAKLVQAANTPFNWLLFDLKTGKFDPKFIRCLFHDKPQDEKEKLIIRITNSLERLAS